MMTSQELTSIVLWTAGALLLGMAGIIKTMVCWRLDRADKRQDQADAKIGNIQKTVSMLVGEHNVNHKAKFNLNPVKATESIRG